MKFERLENSSCAHNIGASPKLVYWNLNANRTAVRIGDFEGDQVMKVEA